MSSSSWYHLHFVAIGTAIHSFARLFGGGLFLFPRKEVSKMMKVRILDQCEFCDGEVWLPGGEAESFILERFYLTISPKRRLALT